MDCRILRQLTLKADGHLGCDDSAGYEIDLGQVVDSDGWRLRRVLDGPVYRHVRQSFARGVLPWPDVCTRCDLLSDGAPPADTLSRRLDLLIEPTLACELSCACCARHRVLSHGRDTGDLSPALVERLVRAAARERIALGQVNYAGQGEPLAHGRFPALVDPVKAHAPFASTIVTTTGNVDFRAQVGGAPLDQIVVSCDGATADSYGRYRRGGQFRRVLDFMRDCRRHGSPGTRLEWKYILFEFNDGEDEILRAQALADDIGVDSLLFIVTNSKWRSQRFDIDRIAEFPLVSSRARIAPAAAMGAVACTATGWQPGTKRPPALGCIDLCNISVGRMLNIEGWAVADAHRLAEEVHVLLDGELAARAAPSFRRDDVVAIHTGLPGPRCGFIFRIPADPDRPPATIELRVIGAQGESWLGGEVTWSMPTVQTRTRADMPSAPMRRIVPLVPAVTHGAA